MFDKNNKILDTLLNKIFGKNEDIQLEHKFLIYATFIAFVINIIGAVVNAITVTSIISLILPFAIAPLVFYLYYQVRFNPNYEKLAIPIFVIGMLVLGIVGIFNGGIDSGNQMTMFAILAIGVIIIPKKYKIYTLILYIVVSSLVIYIQYFYNDWIVPFDTFESRILDNYITILYTAIALYMLILTLFNSYKSEHDKLIESREKLNVMNENLMKVNATRDKFFSIIAHDLRNPIYNFYVVTDLLLKENAKLSEAEKLEFLELSRESSKNVYLMLENLLTLVKSNQGLVPISFSDVILKHILVGNIGLLTLQLLNKQIEIINNYKGDFYVYVDENLLGTIIRNLISNSIKFTKQNGKIWIDVDENYKDEKFILVSISDNGIGMSQTILNKLFQIEIQVSQLGTNDEKGSGLGLLLCKEFIEKLGGKIWAESEEGKGSKFSFLLLKSSKNNQ
ncbi:MAG: sensor histidine kinase [Candidatus Kapaibacteriota bacterium]|jgi:signal transduction histidine kinase